jgi:hypothetical protein
MSNRNIIAFLSAVALIGCSKGASSVNQSLVTLIQQRTIYLNGGARAAFGGKSRTTIKVDLPEKTKSWYYSFSTAPGESGAANLDLGLQLAALSIDPSGVTSGALSQLTVPKGASTIDVYLLDESNSDLFKMKVDNSDGTFRYVREGTIENTAQGIVQIDDVKSGTIYLGLKNPSTLNGVNIVLEVVAIVEKGLFE